MPLPLDAPVNAWIFLSLSGLVGFVFADLFLFNAYGTVGPRVAMLFMALSPPMTAGIAYLFLGELMGPKGYLGMALVISGIILTILGKSGFNLFRKDHTGPKPGIKITREEKQGYVYAFLSSLGQSVGMSLTKIGVAGYDPVSGTQIRVLTAIIGFGIVSLVMHRGKNIITALKSVSGLKYTAIGAVFGPFLGVTLSLFAIQRTNAGIVSTFVGLTPVLILAPEIIFQKKKVKPLEIMGAIVAVGGSIIFFL